MIRLLILMLIFCSGMAQAQRSEFPGTEVARTPSARLLQEYVQIPSVSGNESEAGEFFKETCRSRGLHIKEMGQEDGRYNFMASLFPLEEKRPNIVLLNHIDVVPEHPENAHGPYSGIIENGYLYGRGAFDNKGAAVMLLEALTRIKTRENYQDSHYNISLLAVSCEETQCPGGIQYVLSNYAEEINAAAVIGEGPTDISVLMNGEFSHPVFAISLAHKRVYWIELEIEIENFGHGSITPETYANKEMVAALKNLTKKKQKAVFNEVNTEFLRQMAQYRKGVERLVLKHPRFFKPILVPQLRKTPELFSIFSNTVTLTNISSSSQTINANSTSVKAGLDCRLLPGTDEKAFEEHIRKRLKNENITIKAVKTTPRNQPSSAENIFYTNLRKGILEGYPGAKTVGVLMPNASDLGQFRALGVPSYGSIPIRLTRSEVESIHGLDERMPLEQLEAGVNAYYNFLKKMIYERSEGAD